MNIDLCFQFQFRFQAQFLDLIDPAFQYQFLVQFLYLQDQDKSALIHRAPCAARPCQPTTSHIRQFHGHQLLI
jgi:hypothetical protein